MFCPVSRSTANTAHGRHPTGRSLAMPRSRPTPRRISPRSSASSCLCVEVMSRLMLTDSCSLSLPGNSTSRWKRRPPDAAAAPAGRLMRDPSARRADEAAAAATKARGEVSRGVDGVGVGVAAAGAAVAAAADDDGSRSRSWSRSACRRDEVRRTMAIREPLRERASGGGGLTGEGGADTTADARSVPASTTAGAAWSPSSAPLPPSTSSFLA
mmetsp:Transcript_10135/g.32131  ORF Transcript_10135/g.32131 Transcript_10135/m.32131 type:complete len:213 (-) Transcript_10135:396-1034(-)